LAAAALFWEWGLQVTAWELACAATLAARRDAERIARILPWAASRAELEEQSAALARDIDGRVLVIGDDGSVLADSAPEAGLPVPSAASEGRVSAMWRDERSGKARTVVVSLPVRRLRVGGAVALVFGGWVVALTAVALWPLPLFWRRLVRYIDSLAKHAAGGGGREAALPQPPRAPSAVRRLHNAVQQMAARLAAELHAAREEKSKLEAVLRSMSEGVVVVDRAGAVRLANDRAREVFGLARQPLEGRLLVDLCRDPELHEVLREATQSSQAVVRTRLLGFESGAAQQVQVTVAPVAAGGQLPEGFVCVFHDVTELRRLEAARRDFVANVSHELRTPLTAIRGYAETLAAGIASDPERAQRFADIICRHAERLGRLVDDLLVLSDLELGRTPLRRVPMALRPAVDAAAEVVRAKAAERRIAMEISVPEHLPQVLADRDRIEQLLVNLLDNAVKYTASGGRVRVDAEVAVMPDRGTLPPPPGRRGERCVGLHVRDTGIGIPRQDLPRITERFFRVDRARSRELGGTGLGLAIVKHIVQGHEGCLGIESEYGRGTTVSVYLPLG